jgi:hypothetical protein
MDNNELRDLLHQLDGEIKNTHTVDEESSQLLHDLEQDISALLERSDDNFAPVHPSVIQRLESAVDHFEVTHPSLTALISSALDSLSGSGI